MKMNMKNILISICLGILSNCLWSQDDPYLKKVQIPTELEKSVQKFLQSSCNTVGWQVEYVKRKRIRGRCYSDGKYTLFIPYRYKKVYYTSHQKKISEGYNYTTTEQRQRTTKDDGHYWVDEKVTKYEPAVYELYYEPTERLLQILAKLPILKAYNLHKRIIETHQKFGDKNFQDSVKNEINTKYSAEEYKKYLNRKEIELEQLIKEWEAVPLTSTDIEKQTKNVRLSWRNFEQERSKELAEFDSQCQILLKAKQFVYKYEHDIP